MIPSVHGERQSENKGSWELASSSVRGEPTRAAIDAPTVRLKVILATVNTAAWKACQAQAARSERPSSFVKSPSPATSDWGLSGAPHSQAGL